MAAGARGRLHNAALGNNDDVLARELLLELADEADADLLERLELGNGHKQDDCALRAASVDLLGGGDVERLELGLELGSVVLEVKESGRDRLFCWIYELGNTTPFPKAARNAPSQIRQARRPWA